MPERHSKIHGRLAVRRVEGPVFSRMLVNIHRYVKGALNVCDRGIYFDDHPVRRGPSNGHPIVACKADNSVVVTPSRAEHIGELLDTEILSIVRADWIIEILKESVQTCLIANRQA